jgi:hypothetical protein
VRAGWMRRMPYLELGRDVTIMSLKLPNLAASKCLGIVACARFPDQDRSLMAWFKRNERSMLDRVARVRVNGVLHWVRLGISEGHFHLEMARREFFAMVPEPTTKITEIRKLASEVMGRAVDLSFEAWFTVSDELPGIIRSAMVESKSEGVSLRTVGGTISVTGGPIYRIVWNAPVGKPPIVGLESLRKTKISETYIGAELELIHAAFNAFVLGGRPSAPVQKQD